MRADSQQLARSFVDVTLKLQEVADNEYKRKQRLQLVQKQIQAFYTNSYFQSLIVFLILGNIACAIVELQIHPEGQLAFIFYVLDVIFTLAFLIELLLNMAANWFRAFWLSSFNVFDFIVVAITTVSLLPSVDMKVVSSLRLLRALRVVRIFARLGSARRIIMALSAAVIPVCNVLVVVIGTMCVFAILGATAYPNSSRFSTFSNAFFSLFQILCLEGWTIILVDVESSNKNPPVPGKLFFVCYIFLVVFVLIPVFIAAILDGYRTAAFQQSQDELHERHMQALSTETVRMAIDPILEILSQVSNIQQLHARLEVLFALLDLDEGGSLAYEELAAGLRKMNHVTSALTLEEFETIHQGGKYIDAAGKMSLDNFKAGKTTFRSRFRDIPPPGFLLWFLFARPCCIPNPFFVLLTLLFDIQLSCSSCAFSLCANLRSQS
jgi:Ca2+-binding EF-hand superfamily protein